MKKKLLGVSAGQLLPVTKIEFLPIVFLKCGTNIDLILINYIKFNEFSQNSLTYHRGSFM